MVATSPHAVMAEQAGPQSAARFQGLDGLRGLAVLVVVASHLSNARMIPLPGMAGAGKAGVYLFFVLSSFLLTHALLGMPRAQLSAANTWLNYGLRRVLRIWPLYLVVLGLSWVMTAAGVDWWHFRIAAPAFLEHVTLRAGQSVLWSIPVEFKFYFCLPLIALGLSVLHRAARHAIVEVMALAFVAASAFLAWPAELAEPNDVRLHPYIVVFLAGSFAAYIHRRLGVCERRASWGATGAMALLAFLATLPVSRSLILDVPFDPLFNHRWFAFFGVAWAALLLAVVRGPWWLSAPFESPPMRALGRISYSVYLWHMPVIAGVQAAGHFDGRAALALVCLTTFAVSAVSYFLIERPLQSIRL